MKKAHNVKMKVFCKEGENQEKLEEVFHKLLEIDFEKEKVNFKKKNAQGFEEKNIIIIELVLDKERHIRAFLDKLNEMMSKDQKELLIKQADSRIDDNLHFFIRLDKKKMLNGECWISDKGDCYRVEISIAAFPKKKDIALGVLKEIFK